MEPYLHVFLTSALHRGEWLAWRHGRFIPNTYWTGGWMDTTGGPNGYPCRKSNPGCPAQSLLTILTELLRLYLWN